jgi:hypothetical protein
MPSSGHGDPQHQYASDIIAVPASQQSQHYGERAITNVDYDGVQTVRSENVHPRHGSHSHHRRGSPQSSKAPDIFIQRK